MNIKVIKVILPSFNSCKHSNVTSNWKGFVNDVGLSNTVTWLILTNAIFIYNI